MTAKGLEWDKMFTDGYVCEKDKIYEMKQTEKFSKYVFKIHDKRGNIGEKAEKSLQNET